jgi:hypothetical protein
MEDKKSINKIKRETQIYWHQKNKPLKWGDIKHLQLEDDDLIISGWEDDSEAEYNGYWHGSITRMVEETEDQFKKRQKEIEQERERMKKMRYESYLRLKKEFENE